MKHIFSLGAAIVVLLMIAGELFAIHVNQQSIQMKLEDHQNNLDFLSSLTTEDHTSLLTMKQSTMQSKPEQFGSVNAVAGIPYYLYGSGVGTSDTTVTLTSFKQPVSGYKLAMIDFGDIGYLTLEPGNSTRQEFVSFTGVTQNTDNTATLTGVTRGLSFVSPFTASSTLKKAHGGGTTAVLSNPPQFYERFANKSNTQTISAVWSFGSTTPPKYDFSPDFTNLASSTLASIGYVASTSYAGTVNASRSAKGIIQIATGLQLASSTQLGSTGAFLVAPGELATSSPGSNATSTIVMTDANGKIQSVFINKLQTYNWSALHTFYSALTSTATTTIAASSTVGNALVINTLPFAFSSTRGASSTVLSENGSGSLSFVNVPIVLAQKNSSGTNNANATTTIDTVVIPANTLTTTSSLRVTAMFIGGNPAGCWFGISMGNGAATTTIAFTSQQSFRTPAMISGVIMATSTTNAVSMFHGNQPTNANSPVTGSFSNNSGWDMAAYPAYTFTAQTYLQFESRATGSVCDLAGVTVEKLAQ